MTTTILSSYKQMRNRLKGIYLVIDPSMEKEVLLAKLKEAVAGGIDVVQIWNNWSMGYMQSAKVDFINEILRVTKPLKIPVLINEDWQLLLDVALDGVHFDRVPDNFDELREIIGTDRIVGLTCGNDAKTIAEAKAKKVDYISFCSMFASSSVESCDIVQPDSVLAARKELDIPIFLSGGITPANIKAFESMDFQGIAVISGIMNATRIKEKINDYKSALTQIGK